MAAITRCSASSIGQLNRAALLVVDNFLFAPAAVAHARDLLEVIEDRSQLRSAMVASQLPG